jgi:hypothetical protein
MIYKQSQGFSIVPCGESANLAYILQVVIWVLVGGMAVIDTATVDQDIGQKAGVHNLLHYASNLCLVIQVTREDGCFAAKPLCLFLDCRLRGVALQEYQVCPGGCKRQGETPTNTARWACDHGGFAYEGKPRGQPLHGVGRGHYCCLMLALPVSENLGDLLGRLL